MSLRSLASPWSLVLLVATAGCGDTTTPPPAADMSVSVSDASIDLARPPAGCTSDAMCMGDTPRCDMATGKCVACLEDGHCPEGSVCRGGACAPGCSAMKGCGDAGTCDVDAGAC